MRRMILIILAATWTGPACAGDTNQNFSGSTPIERYEETERRPLPGHRLSATDDFVLVEHGHWAPPPPPDLSGEMAVVDRPAIPMKPKSRTPKKSSASNFRRAVYLPHVYAAETRFALPTGLLDALIWTESRYNPVAVSHAGAVGLGQLMPGTAKEMGVVNRFDPRANIAGAARYLRQMLDRFGMVHLALAAYNAGPGTVARVRGIPLNGETPSYVVKVLARWQTH